MPEINHKDLPAYLKNLGKHHQLQESSPLFLIYGEELLYKTAFEELRNELIPDAKRNLNYIAFDGAIDDITEAIENVNTYSLLSGTKVVAIYDSKIFYSKQDESRLINKAKDAFEINDVKKAATYFLKLLGLLNLRFDDVSEENRKKALRLDSESLDDGWMDKIISYCVENNLPISSGEGSVSYLIKAIEKGFPKDNHLIITADMVDKRSKLYKTIREYGTIIDCSVPKGDRRADRIAQGAVLNDRMNAILGQSGKTMDQNAYRAMYDMTGFDLRTFSSNLQKLVSYVGDREIITASDVENVLQSTKKDPIYELTNAISDRNIEDALFFLGSLLTENIHPLQILAALTNQMRRILLVKGFVESPYGSLWHKGVRFERFKNTIMPAIQSYDSDLLDQINTWEMMLSEEKKGNQKEKKTGGKRKSTSDLVIVKNPKNPYPVYKMIVKSDLFTKDELISILENLSQTDIRLKSTGQNPKIILERAILHICHVHQGGRLA
jgi:DNA polymerase-3 subunit delta